MALGVRVFTLLLAACLLLASAGLSQTGQGTIVGLVTDSTSAIMPGASVTLIHEQTGFSYTAGGKSNQEPSFASRQQNVEGQQGLFSES